LHAILPLKLNSHTYNNIKKLVKKENNQKYSGEIWQNCDLYADASLFRID